MASDNISERGQGNLIPPGAEDAMVEAGLLGFVLAEHPTHLTIPELSLVLNRESGDFASNDAVERAIRELVGAGLLRICDGLVVPSRAALHYDGLEVV